MAETTSASSLNISAMVCMMALLRLMLCWSKCHVLKFVRD
jgi:hypothetical protein